MKQLIWCRDIYGMEYLREPPVSLHIFFFLLAFSFAHLLRGTDWQNERQELSIKPLFLWLIIYSSLYKWLILFPQNIPTLNALPPRNEKEKLGLTNARIYQISVVCAYRSRKDYLILLNLLLEFDICWSLWVLRFNCFWRFKWETACLVFKFSNSSGKIMSCILQASISRQ